MMKNLLLLGAAGLAAYGLWLNYNKKKTMTVKPLAKPTTVVGSVDQQSLMASADVPEIVPDAMLKNFDARPEATTVKTLARVKPIGIGAGCIDLVETYDGTYVFYKLV